MAVQETSVTAVVMQTVQWGRAGEELKPWLRKSGSSGGGACFLTKHCSIEPSPARSGATRFLLGLCVSMCSSPRGQNPLKITSAADADRLNSSQAAEMRGITKAAAASTSVLVASSKLGRPAQLGNIDWDADTDVKQT